MKALIRIELNEGHFDYQVSVRVGERTVYDFAYTKLGAKWVARKRARQLARQLRDPIADIYEIDV